MFEQPLFTIVPFVAIRFSTQMIRVSITLCGPELDAWDVATAPTQGLFNVSNIQTCYDERT